MVQLFWLGNQFTYQKTYCPYSDGWTPVLFTRLRSAQLVGQHGCQNPSASLGSCGMIISLYSVLVSLLPQKIYAQHLSPGLKLCLFNSWPFPQRLKHFETLSTDHLRIQDDSLYTLFKKTTRAGIVFQFYTQT